MLYIVTVADGTGVSTYRLVVAESEQTARELALPGSLFDDLACSEEVVSCMKVRLRQGLLCVLPAPNRGGEESHG